MIYSKILIEKFSHETGFIGSNIEKVIRLLDVLDFIFSKSSFQEKLVLKGGTAINLAYTNLARLSVDIDLDYHGSILREVAVADREKISNELDSFMLSEQYELSPKQGKALLCYPRYIDIETLLAISTTLRSRSISWIAFPYIRPSQTKSAILAKKLL